MEELVRSYWWLVFPFSAIVFGAFRDWLRHLARRNAMAVLAAYARAGREPPAELAERLNR